MYNNNYTATQDIALHNAIQLYGKTTTKLSNATTHVRAQPCHLDLLTPVIVKCKEQIHQPYSFPTWSLL